MKLILASNSPRRREILAKFGYDFEVVVSDFDEGTGVNPADSAMKNAEGKAVDVFNKLNDDDAVVLGADTVVHFKGEILGKPKSPEDAVNTLKRLSGNSHEVITGYCICSKKQVFTSCTKTDVIFNKLSKALIDRYVQSGSPMDKAGSYGIQDGYPLVESYVGSINNIIGLPIEDVMPELLKVGIQRKN